jgi:uncharacterized phage protein gp47/JayE
MNDFLKDYDDLLQDILVDYRNLDPQPDTSEGSMTFILSACMASMLYGLYKYQDWIQQQIFPDSCTTENLDHHGSILGLTRLTITNADGTPGKESDANFLTRIFAFLRTPASGGNAVDWANWTKYYPDGTRIVTITNLDADGNGYYVDDCVVSRPSAGVISLIITPYVSDTGGDPSAAALAELHALITANIEIVRPVTAYNYSIYDPANIVYDVNIEIDVDSYTTELANQIETDIELYIDSLVPGQTMYLSKLEAIAISDGCNGANVTLPTADVIPTVYQLIKKGTITCTSM